MNKRDGFLGLELRHLAALAAKHEEIDLERLATDGNDAPVIKMVNLILAQAVKEKASDIHIEPFHTALKLRYRVDGELVPAESPLHPARNVSTRLAAYRSRSHRLRAGYIGLDLGE